MTIENFKINVPDIALEDLHRRLDATRWPEALENVDWQMGSDLCFMKSLADYWRNSYNWREQETLLNQLPQYRAAIDGFHIHFVHVRSKVPKPMPLIITALWKLLMAELGYQRFGAQGGDWGSAVSTALGLEYPESIVGIHLNYIAGRFLLGGSLNQSPDDQIAKGFLVELRKWWDEEGGYSHIQSTRPQTLGYGLNDSPVGLAAWIIEKFRAWSDCNGNVESVFTRDELLTNVMIYWVTQTITSSTRLYYETRERPIKLSPANRVKPPVAVALFPGEIAMPPRELAERGYNIVRWTTMPRGGHFAAMEQPELLAQDLRDFFRPLR